MPRRGQPFEKMPWTHPRSRNSSTACKISKMLCIRKALFCALLVAGFLAPSFSRADTNDTNRIIEALNRIYVILDEINNYGLLTFPTSFDDTPVSESSSLDNIYSTLQYDRTPYLAKVLNALYGLGVSDLMSQPFSNFPGIIPTVSDIRGSSAASTNLLADIDKAVRVLSSLTNRQDAVIYTNELRQLVSRADDLYQEARLRRATLQNIAQDTMLLPYIYDASIYSLRTNGLILNTLQSHSRGNSFQTYVTGMDPSVLSAITTAINNMRVEIVGAIDNTHAENIQGRDQAFDNIIGQLDDLYDLLFILNANVEDGTEYARKIHYDDFNYNGSQRSVKDDFGYHIPWVNRTIGESVAGDLKNLSLQLGFSDPSETNSLWSFLGYYNTGRSVQMDLDRLHVVLGLLTNIVNTATNEAFATSSLASIEADTSSAVSEASEAQDTAEEGFSSLTNINLSAAIDYVNPYAQITSGVARFGSQLSDNTFPDFEQLETETIFTLFDANSGNEQLDRCGSITLNFAEEYISLANSFGTVMEWVWGVVNAISTLALIRGFWGKIHEVI